MSIGNQVKHAFDEMVRMMGCTVVIHKDWGTPHEKMFERRGLKNNEKNRPENVMFQFPEVVDIQVGDFLQQKGARDLWRVIDVEDKIHADVLLYFEARVEKFTGQIPRSSSDKSKVVVHGSVYGGIQLDSPQATQNINVQILKTDENIKKLQDLLKKAPISQIDREEALLALERIAQLARKEKTPEVASKIREKLNLVKATLDIAKDIAQLAAPYIGYIAQTLI